MPINPDAIRPITRTDARRVEAQARRVMAKETEEETRLLCRMVIQLINRMDGYAVNVFPVFDLMDTEIRLNGCHIEYDGKKLRVVDPNGKCLSFGDTFRGLMSDHAVRHLTTSIIA